MNQVVSGISAVSSSSLIENSEFNENSEQIPLENQNKKIGSIPSFLIKTYEILENPQLNPIISWVHNGTSFIIHDQIELCNNVLPQYFKHKNFPSFLRQLNMYSFKKQRNEEFKTEFSHKWFRRGGRGLLCHILRRNQENEEELEGDQALKNCSFHQQQNLMNEIQQFRSQYKDLKKDIQKISDTQIHLQSALQIITQQIDSVNKESQSLQKELIGIQRKTQQRFDNYALVLSDIIWKLQFQQQNGQIDKVLFIDQNSGAQKKDQRELLSLISLLQQDTKDNQEKQQSNQMSALQSQMDLIRHQNYQAHPQQMSHVGYNNPWNQNNMMFQMNPFYPARQMFQGQGQNPSYVEQQYPFNIDQVKQEVEKVEVEKKQLQQNND